FRNELFEKLGGWTKYFPFAVAGVPRALWAWLDLNEHPWLGIGATLSLTAINSGTATTITPQTYTSSAVPDVTTTSSSTSVTVTDANLVAGSLQATTYDTVEFLTPLSIDGIILSGSYPVATAGTGYTITIPSAATATRSNK